MPRAERIPDQDQLFRLVDFPRMYQATRGLIWDEVFQFPGGEHESLVWEKYAPTANHVHRLGCEREAAKRSAKPDFRYCGFIPSTAGSIRAVKTPTGHGFALRHMPGEGRHHVGIFFALNPEAGGKKLSKGEKGDLKFRLRKVFGDLVPHSCAGAHA